MQAIHPVSAPPQPSPASGTGSDRTDHATSARSSEPAKVPETARPAAAPEKTQRTERYTADRPRAPEPAQARPDTVVAARSTDQPAPPNKPAENAARNEPVPEPDPLVPPVPMKYLAKLLFANTDARPAVPTPEPREVDEAERAPVAVIAAAEKAAEAGSSLDVLR